MRRIVLILIVSILMFAAGAAFNSLITKENIAHAEKIIGLDFTEAERDSMQDNLNEYLESYKRIRAFDPQNHILPAITFNPLPEGFEIEKEQRPIIFSYIFSSYMPTIPKNKEELAFYSVSDLAQLIKSKQITSTELTKIFLNRLKKYSPELENVITLTEELALEQAAKADREIAAGNYKGLLHGIPYGVKDLLSTKKYKTTWGATPYKDQVIDKDAEVVKRLEAAGAVLVAKLSMGALAWGDVWYGGFTRTPWNIKKGASGSSAGSASAVAAGLVPFAIGTETWGSIVSPSTVNGVTGLRPTYGRVSREGAMALSWSMDKIGPICRNAEDCAIVFNAIYGPDGNDPTLIDAPFNYNASIDFSKYKIGYIKKDFEADYAFRKQDSMVLEQLRKLGANLVPVELPSDLPVNDLGIILSAEAAAAFEELTRTNKDDQLVRQIKNAWPNVFRSARFIPAVEYINANRIRKVLIQEMDSIFHEVDFYMAPSWHGDNLLITNLTGHPTVVVPTGFDKDGMPVSITFNGKLFDEGTILSAARAYQNVTSYHKTFPPKYNVRK